MHSVRVSSSNNRELPAPELGPGLSWDRLTEILLREVSAEAAGLLAEPVQDEARGQTHWHITAHDDPKPVAALSDAERSKLTARLNDRRREILRFATAVEADGGDANLSLAAALRSVISVPDEKLHVWSADGKPVLTAWGRTPAGRQGPTARFVRRQPAAPPPPSLHGADIASHGTSNALPGAGLPGSQETQPPPRTGQTLDAPPPPSARRWPAFLLWVLFALLVAIGYRALLPACGLDLPWLGRLSDHCAFARSAALDAARLRTAALRDAIKTADLQVARNRAACAPR